MGDRADARAARRSRRRSPTGCPRRRGRSIAVRVWPLAALVVYLAPVGTFPYHAFQGLAHPALDPRRPGRADRLAPPARPLAVAALLALMSVPGIAHKLEVSIHSIRTAGDPFWIFPDEHRALQCHRARPAPRRRRSARSTPATCCPYTTGRETWIGALSWTPDWRERQRLADGLVERPLRGAAAPAARAAHARALRLRRLPPGPARPRARARAAARADPRFGCASVYVLEDRPDMARAAGRPDA